MLAKAWVIKARKRAEWGAALAGEDGHGVATVATSAGASRWWLDGSAALRVDSGREPLGPRYRSPRHSGDAPDEATVF